MADLTLYINHPERIGCRDAVVGSSIYIYLNPDSFTQSVIDNYSPVTADIVEIRDRIGGEPKADLVYEVVTTTDLPPGILSLSQCDISGYKCLNCCDYIDGLWEPTVEPNPPTPPPEEAGLMHVDTAGKGVYVSTGTESSDWQQLAKHFDRDVYIELRADGKVGSGQFDDPYDGSTADRFASAIEGAPEGSVIHIGKGTFLVNGRIDIPRNCGIKGSGIGVTNLLGEWLGSNQFVGLVGADPSKKSDTAFLMDFSLDYDFMAGHNAGFTGLSSSCIIRANFCVATRLEITNAGKTLGEVFPLSVGTWHLPSAEDTTQFVSVTECKITDSHLISDQNAAAIIIATSNASANGTPASSRMDLQAAVVSGNYILNAGSLGVSSFSNVKFIGNYVSNPDCNVNGFNCDTQSCNKIELIGNTFFDTTWSHAEGSCIHAAQLGDSLPTSDSSVKDNWVIKGNHFYVIDGGLPKSAIAVNARVGSANPFRGWVIEDNVLHASSEIGATSGVAFIYALTDQSTDESASASQFEGFVVRNNTCVPVGPDVRNCVLRMAPESLLIADGNRNTDGNELMFDRGSVVAKSNRGMTQAQILSDGAITMDARFGLNAEVTLTQDSSIANLLVTNALPGESGVIKVTQGATPFDVFFDGTYHAPTVFMVKGDFEDIAVQPANSVSYIRWRRNIASPDVMEYEVVTQISDAELAAAVPLVDWQASAWDGAGGLSNRGAFHAAEDLTPTGSPTKGVDARGTFMELDGTADYFTAPSLPFDIIQQGEDFTMLLEGPSVLTLQSSDADPVFNLLRNIPTSGADVGFSISSIYTTGNLRVVFRIADGTNSFSITNQWATGSTIGPGEVITAIAVARKGNRMWLKLFSDADGVSAHKTQAGANVVTGGAAATEPVIWGASPPTSPTSFIPSKINRIRFWDHYIPVGAVSKR